MACTPVGSLEGQRSPDFLAPLVRGGAQSLSELEGSPTVLVFWASWCGPCRAEVPEINALTASVGDTVDVIGVNAGETPQAALKGMQALNVSYPVVLDADGRISQKLAVKTLPTVFILDGERVIRYRGHGLPLRVHALLSGLTE